MKYTQVQKIDKDVIVELEEKKLKLPNELQERIDTNWKILISENPRYTRGDIYCVESIQENKDNVKIKLVYSDYAHYMYDMKNNLDEEYKCRNCWAGTIIETSDNKYIVGRMNYYTSVPNKLQFSGGNIDKKEIYNGIVDMKKCAAREIKEEMNIDVQDYSAVMSFECKYLIKEIEKNSVGILYKIKMKKNYETMVEEYNNYKKYLEKNNLEVEFSELVGINKEEVKKFFECKNIDYEDAVYPALLEDSKN